eukprot:GFUD01020023.1.p1 GENE.GFUD01020023.1~~GFUD01020023.1.p1  ORF type:complete len:132 (+),score=17.17 GFUD01020023.1:207-602(+)
MKLEFLIFFFFSVILYSDALQCRHCGGRCSEGRAPSKTQECSGENPWCESEFWSYSGAFIHRCEDIADPAKEGWTNVGGGIWCFEAAHWNCICQGNLCNGYSKPEKPKSGNEMAKLSLGLAVIPVILVIRG